MGITFNDDQLGAPELKYVLWVDIMGIKEKMSRSLHQSANFIGKFHSVVSSCGGHGITIYPVMDGAYVTFDDQEKAESNVKDCIVKMYTELLHEFVGEKELLHRFLIRGGLAYGPVYSGTRLNKSVSFLLPRSKSPAIRIPRCTGTCLRIVCGTIRGLCR